MGYEYAFVHLKFTIPPAFLLTLLYRPLSTRLDVYRVGFLIFIAVASTIPWDSYLIRNRIWTYPSQVIIGAKLYGIPAEEVFFFIIQTYNTSLLYLILNKATTHAAYLSSTPQSERNISSRKKLLLWTLICVITGAAYMVRDGGRGTYLGLILVWAGPFTLLLWSLAGHFIQRLPLSSTAVPIAIPTIYLWLVDTIALRRGTWVIETGTKTGIQIWRGLEVEEALFFLTTNTLIVFGLVAFDNAMAVLYAFPATFPTVAALPSPVTLVRALLLDTARQDLARVDAIQDAVARLQKKSRSFHFASAFFDGRLRIDLMLLYSFCRVADDLIDNAKTAEDAHRNVELLRKYLDLQYNDNTTTVETQRKVESLVRASFPTKTHSALLHLPCEHLPRAPLYSLVDGFETDLKFNDARTKKTWPIADQQDLETYASRVAGTVAELCLSLILHHTTTSISQTLQHQLVASGERMGIALQYVNIARDIKVDARMDRIYLPTTWLKEANLSAEEILVNPHDGRVLQLRDKLLDEANGIYMGTRSAIESLPLDSRAAMRVAVESYMEIGRVLKSGKFQSKAGRATVPALRRLRVGWRALRR